MPRYVVTHAVTEESALGEERHLATTITSEFPDAERHPDGIWIIVTNETPEDILTKLSQGASEESVMVCEVSATQVRDRDEPH